jgi:hypothetical protein
MNKVKKAVKELRDYLGNDTRGIALLDKLSRITNDVYKDYANERKTSASLRTSLDDANASRSAAGLQTQKAAEALVQERALRAQRDRDVSTERCKVAALQRQLDKLMPELETPELAIKTPAKNPLGPPSSAAELPKGLKDKKALAAAFHSMRKELTVAPPPEPVAAALKHRRVCYMYYLEDIVQDYSPASMMLLGRFIATMSMFGIPSVIATEHVHSYWIEHDNLPHKTLKPFVRWFRHGMKSSKFADKAYDASLSTEEMVVKHQRLPNS